MLGWDWQGLSLGVTSSKKAMVNCSGISRLQINVPVKRVISHCYVSSLEGRYCEQSRIWSKVNTCPRLASCRHIEYESFQANKNTWWYRYPILSSVIPCWRNVPSEFRILSGTSPKKTSRKPQNFEFASVKVWINPPQNPSMAERIPKVQIYLYVLLIEKRNSLIWFGSIPSPPTADVFPMSKGTPYQKWTTYSSGTGCGYPTLSLKLSDIPWFFFPSPACQSLAPLAGLGTGRRAGTMRRIPALWPPRPPHPAVLRAAETAEVGMVEAVQFIGNWRYQQSQLIVPQKEIHGYPRCIAAHKDILFFPGTKNTNMLFMLYFTSLLSEIRLFGEEFPWLELGWEISH